jgi:hypothetical protein
MKSLREKILDVQYPVIFYELLPPQAVTQADLEAYIDCALDLLNSTSIKIDAINIPEIHQEDHDSTLRIYNFTPKVNQAYFAQLLEKACYNNLDVIINHCTVYQSWSEQLHWLEKITAHPGQHYCILVGGSSSTIPYPGPSVLDLSSYIQEHYVSRLFCGGIAIQTRRHKDAARDEDQRLIQKYQHGLHFFTTQIIYDAASIKKLLQDYNSLCIKNNISPQRIILSFAPISTRKDLDFLRWLGVVISKDTEKELFKTGIGVGWRSIKIAENILRDILHFIDKEHIKVPLGLNIEHITRHNFEISLIFINKLSDTYCRLSG